MFVLNLSYKLFLHCYAAVSKVLTDTSCHSVAAELLVQTLYDSFIPEPEIMYLRTLLLLLLILCVIHVQN